jgi:hypothetical protein
MEVGIGMSQTPELPQSFVFGFFTLILSIAGSVASVSWRGRGFFAEAKEDFRKGIDEIRAEIRRDRDDTFQKFGETIRGMQEKFNQIERDSKQIELWGRDNYLKVSDFDKQFNLLSIAINGLSMKVEANARFIEDKISKIKTRDEDEAD